MPGKEVDKKKYAFYKYSNKYPTLYRNEYHRIKRIVPFAEIEHVGSSAVKNLGGKGIIDILVCVNKSLKNKAKTKLETNGYEYTHHADDNDRMFFKRIIKHGNKERRIHVHLVQRNSHSYKSIIGVRNLLKDSPEIAREYANIKKKAVRYAKGNGEKYMKYKNSYLKKLEKQAIRKYFNG